MDKTIKILANKIRIGKDVALYAATFYASQILHALKKEYGLEPRCVVDTDQYQHGKRMLSIEIMSLEKALIKWPDLTFFCASDLYKASIIGCLLEKGISEDKIINYEPVEKYRGCYWAESFCVLFEHNARLCCEHDKSPRVFNSVDLASNTLALRERVICDLKKENSELCYNCQNKQYGYFSVSKKIRRLSIAEGGRCNFSCQYCDVKEAWDDQDIDIVAFTNEIIKLEHNETIGIDIECGEITIHPKRKEIYKLTKNRSTIVATNASVFDEELADIMTEGFCTLNVSLDSGTSKTFAEIKGVDCFEKVKDNLRHYQMAAGYSALILKYIFLPGINTNDQDVNGFLEICKEHTPVIVRISYDSSAPRDIDDDTIRVIQNLYRKLDNLGIVTQFDFIPYEYIKAITERTNIYESSDCSDFSV